MEQSKDVLDVQSIVQSAVQEYRARILAAGNLHTRRNCRKKKSAASISNGG